MSQPVVPRTVREQVFERDGHQCRWCGGTEDLAPHHIVRKANGGRDTIENLVALCRSCNSKVGVTGATPWIRGPSLNPRMLWTGLFVPTWLSSRPELSPGAKLCYAALCWAYSERDGCARMDQGELAARLGVGERQARRYLDTLERWSLIEVKQTGLKLPNEYRFFGHAWMGIAAPDRTDMSGLDRTDVSAPERTDMSGPFLSLEAVPEVRTVVVGGDSVDKSSNRGGTTVGLARQVEEQEREAAAQRVVAYARRRFAWRALTKTSLQREVALARDLLDVYPEVEVVAAMDERRSLLTIEHLHRFMRERDARHARAVDRGEPVRDHAPMAWPAAARGRGMVAIGEVLHEMTGGSDGHGVEE